MCVTCERELQNCNLEIKNARLKDEIKRLDEDNFCYEVSEIEYQRMQKYKSALEEIKDIAKGVRGYLEVPTPRDVRFEMDRILDIINSTKEV